MCWRLCREHLQMRSSRKSEVSRALAPAVGASIPARALHENPAHRKTLLRTEQEMMDLILGVAERDERVRAVVLNGSRANPNAPKGAFQDYDIVHLVTDLDSSVSDDSWIDVFGEASGGAYCPAMQIVLGEWK